jgi:hypothetical protein
MLLLPFIINFGFVSPLLRLRSGMWDEIISAAFSIVTSFGIFYIKMVGFLDVCLQQLGALVLNICSK